MKTDLPYGLFGYDSGTRKFLEIGEIRVPGNAVEAYQTAVGWSRYSKIIKAIN